MKKRIIIFFLVIFIWVGLSTPLWANEPKITAHAAVLIDADTGKILYSKNHLEPRPPASITKILTAIIGIEKGNLEDIVEISTKASQTGEASLNLVANEKITLENLLYGALLKSGNDACVAIAEHLAPTVEDFVNLMNLKAQTLGCFNTNFVNTNGLPAKNHYSTAYDLAIIARYALRNPIFAKIVATPIYTITWEESNRKRTVKNTNKLLTTYPGASGVKTGTTNEAGYCLLASAKRENRNLIAVVLKSRNRFKDAQLLLDYGFNNFRNIYVMQAKKQINFQDTDQEKELVLYTGNNLVITVGKNEKVDIKRNLELYPEKLNTNLKKDEVVGRIKFFNKGLEIGSVQLFSAQDIVVDVEKNNYWHKIWYRIKGENKKS